MDPNHLAVMQKSMPYEPCPIFAHPQQHKRRKRSSDDKGNENVIHILRDDMKLHIRKPLIHYQYYPTYVIWTSNISKVEQIIFNT